MMILDLKSILLGRFLLGFAGGVILCASTLYVAETIPNEQRERYGLAMNNGIIVGMLITNLFGFILPIGGTEESKKT